MGHSGAPLRRRRLRVVTKCASVEEFVALFGSFYDGRALFVMTPALRPAGTVQPTVLMLSDQTPVLAGDAEVVDALEDVRSPYGKAGMRLRFVDPDGPTTAVLRRLAMESASSAAMPTTRIAALGRPKGIGRSLDAALEAKVADVILRAAVVTQRMSALHLTAEVSPASPGMQPFGDAGAEVAELFSCDLYEEEEAAADEVAAEPAATPEERTDPAGPPASLQATTRMAPLENATERMTALAPPPPKRLAVPPSPGLAPLVVAAVAAAAAAIGLLAGYLLWG